MIPDRRRDVARRAAIVLALGAVAAALLVWQPFPLCLTARVLHVPCPGCGLSRASVALARGHVREALALHPLVLVLAPAALAVVLHEALAYVTGRRLALPPALARAISPAAIAIAVATFGVWIARFFGAFGGPVHV